MDANSRRTHAMDACGGHRAGNVVTTLELIYGKVGCPKPICADGGSAFVSRDLDLWAETHNVVLGSLRSRKPTDGTFTEASNGRSRAECRNAR